MPSFLNIDNNIHLSVSTRIYLSNEEVAKLLKLEGIDIKAVNRGKAVKICRDMIGSIVEAKLEELEADQNYLEAVRFYLPELRQM